jgi:hypothetical protein
MALRVYRRARGASLRFVCFRMRRTFDRVSKR